MLLRVLHLVFVLRPTAGIPSPREPAAAKRASTHSADTTRPRMRGTKTYRHLT
ncbi:uncharacterized protein SETTUDRAFT_43810 [Exserohilum turcica Et28A]|uniref:Uncharacterized protein n=1 Tax=Exserohilum turcicum (strain 28A) TaxID=671987 RepID=R0K020_EXST2|nr:uncharacterized protein SETTUDRAFT_43810 [Exserohilum turcica Et28A]EOA81802.1 hypothetical protein SETTUDRAFT_43810 [Exserohilum turcica Et28A]